MCQGFPVRPAMQIRHRWRRQTPGMAHPLVWNAAGELLVQTEFEIKLRVEGPVRFRHEPGSPIGVLLPDHFHFRAPAPTWSVVVPFNLILADFAQDLGTYQIANRDLVGFAAM